MGRAKRKWSSGRRAHGAGYGGGRQMDTASGGSSAKLSGSTADAPALDPEPAGGSSGRTNSGPAMTSSSAEVLKGTACRVGRSNSGGFPAAEHAASRRQ